MISRLASKARVRRDMRINASRLQKLTSQVAKNQAASTESVGKAVVFNASTRLGNLSLNAAYSLLTAWGLRQSGWQVIHFVCQSGMSRCLLGSSELDPDQRPPCESCTALSARMFAEAEVAGFSYHQDPALLEALAEKSIEELKTFDYDGLPLGELVLPSLRWRMRRYHLDGDPNALILYREYIQSAYQIAREFKALLDREDPDLVQVFNGQMFPEAVTAYLARQRGIYTITHETGYQPDTVFMTSGDATARKVFLNESERILTDAQNEKLDDYLEKRFEGRFSMGGIQFWRGMEALPEEIERRLDSFEQIVPIFSNVIFDTSQAHANRAFEHMFAWLDETLQIVKENPDTLFVLRAHPDELRPNSRKKSRETVASWVMENGAGDLPNLVFIDPLQYISSYDLIRRSKFILAYNSSIALEAALLGKASVCAGWAWYSDYPTVYSPQTPDAYRRQVNDFLSVDTVVLSDEFRQMARSLVYYQNFRVSLPFGRYLEPHEIRGYARLKSFDPQQLTPEHDLAIQSIITGIADQAPVIRLPE